MAEALAAIGGAAAVLELSKAACSLAQTLYTFSRNAKHVNENIRELAAEVDSLGAACSMVHTVLASLEQDYSGKSSVYHFQHKSLWTCVEEQVQECRRTINLLAKSLEGMRRDRSGFLAQASRSIRLTLKKDSIADIRSRIKLHLSCLQVTLQSANIIVSNLAPKRADHELLDRISALSKDVKDLKRRQAETGQTEVSTRRSSIAALRLSEEIITSGRKLYRESIRSGTVTRTSTNTTLLDTPYYYDKQGAEASEKSAEAEDFASEIADATAEAARTAFERQEWSSAIAYIDELCHGIKRGSFRLRSTSAIGSFDLIIMHAVSSCHAEAPNLAKLRLLKAAEQCATNDEERMKVCDSQHYLAMTYLRLDDLHSANETCKLALETRRQVFGRTHHSFLESLALMSRIHGLQGNLFRAQVYLTMIPESAVDHLKVKYQNLGSATTSDQGRKSIPLVPLVSNDVAGLGISSLTIAVGDDITKTDLSCVAGAEDVVGEMANSPSFGRPPLISSNTEDVAFPSTVLNSIQVNESRLLPSPPSTAIPQFSLGRAPAYHRRNQSAPMGSRTVPGSPPLPSPRALEPVGSSVRPLGTTGLFRGISSRVRRSWLASLNLRPVGDAEKAICKGDLMALHAALGQESQNRWLAHADVEVRNRSRALHFSALFGDVRMAHVLIMDGFDVHAAIPMIAVPGQRLFVQNADDDYEIALHLAIAARHAPMVEYLLSQEASLYDGRLVRGLGLDLPTANLLDIEWLRTTQCNSVQEVIDVLKVLLDAGWDINRPLSLRESRQESVAHRLLGFMEWPFEKIPLLSFCIDSGFDVSNSLLEGNTILAKAVETKDDEVTSNFLTRGFEEHLNEYGPV